MPNNRPTLIPGGHYTLQEAFSYSGVALHSGSVITLGGPRRHMLDLGGEPSVRNSFTEGSYRIMHVPIHILEPTSMGHHFIDWLSWISSSPDDALTKHITPATAMTVDAALGLCRLLGADRLTSLIDGTMTSLTHYLDEPEEELTLDTFIRSFTKSLRQLDVYPRTTYDRDVNGSLDRALYSLFNVDPGSLLEQIMGEVLRGVRKFTPSGYVAPAHLNVTYHE